MNPLRGYWGIAAAMLLLCAWVPVARGQELPASTWGTVGSDGTSAIEWRVYRPAEPTRTGLLLLHGWDMECSSWFEMEALTELSEEMGWTMMCPELGRSVYEWEQRDEAGAEVPGVMHALVASLNHRRELWSIDTVHALGFSTGGRGVAMLASTGTPIRCAASVSGTFDLEALAPGTGEYRIHARVWGERADATVLWDRHEVCVPINACVDTRWWVAHGSEDGVVDPEQSVGFVEDLVSAGADATLWLADGAGHDTELLDEAAGRVADWFRASCIEASPAPGSANLSGDTDSR